MRCAGSGVVDGGGASIFNVKGENMFFEDEKVFNEKELGIC